MLETLRVDERIMVKKQHVIVRGESGHFAKGMSANPGGRSNAWRAFRALARTHCPRAIHVLAENMGDENGHVRNFACSKMIEIGYGKIPAFEPESVEGDGLKRVLGYDLSKLSVEQLKTLRDLIALARTSETVEGEMVDVTPGAESDEG